MGVLGLSGGSGDGYRGREWVAGVPVGAAGASAMWARWQGLGLRSAVRFVAAGERGEGLDGVGLVAGDRNRVGESHDIGGVTFTLV